MNNKLTLLILLLSLCSLSPALSMSTPPQDPLQALQAKVEIELHSMDLDLSQAASDLAGQGLTGSQANAALLTLYQAHKSIVDVATIDPDGTLLLIQPAQYRDSIGQNISGQAHFMQLRNSNGPVMSNLFKAVEGFHAVSLAYPVLAADRLEKAGYISLVFQPQALVHKAAEEAGLSQGNFEIMAIQDDGRIIYDKDPLQVGKMTFSDPLYQKYPSLLKLARRIIDEGSGSGVYEFPAKGSSVAVQKKAVWTTVNVRSATWRLVVAKEI
ncbi:hypothetical protein ACFL4J_00730 [Candidatus Margulisiibacteriota bacterium]